MTAGPLFAGIGGHHSPRGKTNEWLTPPFLLEARGGAESFDLDPCTPVAQPYPTARARYTQADNGLLKPWFGRVWLNPPYSTADMQRFMSRMCDHGRGTALIFARTETQSFFEHVWHRAHGLLFLEGRINFHLPDGRRAKANSGAPSVLCAYGVDDMDVLATTKLVGQFVPLRLPRSIVIAALEPTWRQALAGWLSTQHGPVSLSEIYQQFASHPKAQKNRHWREKIRQVLQQGAGVRVDQGRYQACGY